MMEKKISYWDTIKYCISYIWKSPLKYAVIAVFLLICACFVEVFIFNYKHWTSIFNEKVEAKIEMGDGYEDVSDGEYRVLQGDHNIYLRDINCKIKNIKLEIIDLDKINNPEGSVITVLLDGMDVSHSDYYFMGKRDITSKEKRSFYITPHFYGEAKAAFLTIYPEEGHTLRVDIEYNTVIPLFFMLERVILVWAILLIGYFFKNGSVLNRIEYRSVSTFSKIIIISMIMIINFFVFKNINELNWYYQGEYQINTAQYCNLARAFSEGQLYLLDEPCETLKNMDNPYDAMARGKVMEFDEWYFDHAYYNGHYYVYFGAGPVVLLYLPYYLLTGDDMHNHTACLIGVLLIILGIMLLYDRLIEVYYRKCSVAIWALLCELTILGSSIVYVSKRPDMYSVPITFAVAFIILGMCAFLKAMPAEDCDNYGQQEKKLNIFWLAVGSFLTAYTVSCRPQVFFAVILDVIILRKYCFNFKYLKTSNGKKALAAVFGPMFIVAVFVMLYNYLRFGSVFDFGAFYNLTFNDMRYRGFVWDRLPYGFVQYLLMPLKLNPEYPYFGGIDKNTVYIGETIQETTYGGLFFTAPFALIGFIGIAYYKYLKKNKSLFCVSLGAILIGMLIIVFDITNAGILERYFFDFSFLFMIASSLTVLNVMKNCNNRIITESLNKVLIVFVIYEILYQVLVFINDSGGYLIGNRRDLYYHLYYLTGFGI